MAKLVEDWYGKGEVRLTKVVRNGERHELFEFCVQIVLEGDFERVYTQGDNASCIPTDTMKNTVYTLAKKHAFTSPEEFGVVLTGHFVEKFSQVTAASATIEQVLWRRIEVSGVPHAHAFEKASPAVRTASVRRERGGGVKISGGVRGLEVIKTTKSGFAGFLRDEYTTLKETTDRIFGTSVEAVWEFAEAGADFNGAFEGCRKVILEVFATHDSLGVQQTIFAMGQAVLAAVPAIGRIGFTMPNQHRILFNLEPFGMSNANEIFVTTSEPYGLIHGTVER